MLSGGGTYALVLEATLDPCIRIGKLGELRVGPGFYVYVGSAFGSGGLRARIAHHRRIAARPRWHVDYLRRFVPIVEIWCARDQVRRECQWAAAMAMVPYVSIPMRGFGSSDCACFSHLFFYAHEKPNPIPAVLEAARPWV